MKNYFKFNLTGQKLLPVWLAFYVLFLAPYVVIISQAKKIQPGGGGDYSAYSYILPAILFLMLINFAITYFIAKLTIEGIEFKEKPVVFNGTFGRYVVVILVGLFFSIITLGIYIPWFIRNVNRFFGNNSSLNDNPFEFKGKGGELFLILLVTFFIPYVIIIAISTLYKLANPSLAITGLIQLVTTFVMIPYMYYFYKWMVNLRYKGYSIVWETDSWEACGKMAGQIGLCVITLGIYTPAAVIKLYKYFTERTVAISETGKKKFNYDIEPMADFLFLWGQTLLIIVTLGIYYPWASCKMVSRILGKTSLEEIEAA